jgi:hypothetical protein
MGPKVKNYELGMTNYGFEEEKNEIISSTNP